MSFYLKRRKSARKLIVKRGVQATLIREINGALDASAGVVVGGSEESINIHMVAYPYKKKKGEGETVTQMQEAIIAAETITGQALAFPPKVGMEIVTRGIRWEVKSVDPLAPGGEDVLYTVTIGY